MQAAQLICACTTNPNLSTEMGEDSTEVVVGEVAAAVEEEVVEGSEEGSEEEEGDQEEGDQEGKKEEAVAAKDAKQHKDLGRDWACGFGNHKVGAANLPASPWPRPACNDTAPDHAHLLHPKTFCLHTCP